MLALLLFAGSLHVELARLRQCRRIIFVTATIGVALSAAIFAFGLRALSWLTGSGIGLAWGFALGAMVVETLPGACELLTWLSESSVPWAIATSGRMETAAVNLAALGVDPQQKVVVTRNQVRHAKPDPDLFIAAAERLGAPIEQSIVVGDSIWDMLAATRAGAIRIYEDPADLLLHNDEVRSRR